MIQFINSVRMESVMENKKIVDEFIFLYNAFNINTIKNLLTIMKGNGIILVKLYELKYNDLLSRAGRGRSPTKPGNRLLTSTVLILTAEMLKDKKLFFSETSSY